MRTHCGVITLLFAEDLVCVDELCKPINKKYKSNHIGYISESDTLTEHNMNGFMYKKRVTGEKHCCLTKWSACFVCINAIQMSVFHIIFQACCLFIAQQLTLSLRGLKWLLVFFENSTPLNNDCISNPIVGSVGSRDQGGRDVQKYWTLHNQLLRCDACVSSSQYSSSNQRQNQARHA